MILNDRLSAKNDKTKKVFVALSGGVDSAVAASLLQKEGYEVTGCFMKLYDQDVEDNESSEKSASRIASYLGIDFLIFDFRKEFKRIIIDSFLQDYRQGLTPNPCVLCNEKIKFGLFWEKAHQQGADLMATGHYARIRKRNGMLNLYRAKDKIKDQSYFLWRLKKEQLEKILFPLGNYQKEKIKKMAKKWNLITSEREESMEICFAPGKIEEFLRNNLKISSGPIINPKGETIGHHKGLPFYTIGQRKGIGLSGGPYYVFNKKIEKNILQVTKTNKLLNQSDLLCHQINWLDGEKPTSPINAKIKIRYQHQAVEGIIFFDQEDFVRVAFRHPQTAVTPGQSVVFYRGSKLLGGGVIHSRSLLLSKN